MLSVWKVKARSRADHPWRAVCRFPDGQTYQSGYFPTKSEAKMAGAEWELQLSKISPSQNHRNRTVTDAVDVYVQAKCGFRLANQLPRDAWRTYKAERRLPDSQRTNAVPCDEPLRGRENVVSRLDWWVGRIGNVPLRKLTSADISDALEDLRSTKDRRDRYRSAATINAYHSYLRAALEYVRAEPRRWIRDNPASFKGERVRNALNNEVVLTQAQLKRLLSKCAKLDAEKLAAKSAKKRAGVSATHNLRLIVLLGLSTALREGNIMALKWTDIDFDAGTILVRQTKNDDPHIAPLRGEALVALKKYKRQHRIVGVDWVFPGNQSHAHAEFPRDEWNAAREAAGLPEQRGMGYRFHNLRHNAASYLLQAGCSALEVADFLGHKSLAMVKRYAHTTASHRQDVAEKLAGKLGGVL